MGKLEEQISKIEESKRKLISNNNSSKTIPNLKTQKTKKEKKEEEKEKKIIENQKINPYMIEETVRAKEAYMLALDTLNLTKREYLNSVNSYSDKIKEYDNNENNLLNKLLEIFEKYDEKIRDKNKEVSGVILENKNGENENKIFIEKINKKYEFEEYIPQHNKIDDNNNINILSEMHKLTGYNIEESFSDPKIKKEIKFILSLEAIINDDSSIIKKSSIDIIKEYLNDTEYINKFLKRLNKARIDKELDKNKEVFNNIVDLLNYILTNLIIDTNKNHDLIKNILILSQSFYINDEKYLNKKIFFSNKITTPKEFKTTEFWIDFIEKEIENNNDIIFDNNKLENEENKEKIDEKKEEIKQEINEEKEKIKEEEKIEENKEEKIEENKEEKNDENKEEKIEENNEEKNDEEKIKETKNDNDKNIENEKKEENKEDEKKEDNVEEKKDEIKIENKDNINRNKENAALMVFIGNISNLNDYLSNQSKIKKIFSHFDEIFKFSEENIKKVSDILGFNIK